METQGGTQTEKEGSRRKIQTQRERDQHSHRKRHALKVTWTHAQRMRDRDFYRKKRQMCKETPVQTKAGRAQGGRQKRQSERVAPFWFPFSYLRGKGADRTFLISLHEIGGLPAPRLHIRGSDMKTVKRAEQA